MSAQRSAGHLSRVMWGNVDLQIQTELRYQPSPEITTILVAEGEVISRVRKSWKTKANQVEDQNNVSEYHSRFTRAIAKLHDKGWVPLGELPQIADRLVDVALRFFGESLTAEACTVVPGVRWASLIDKSNKMVENAPSKEITKPWEKGAIQLPDLLKLFSEMFSAGTMLDMTLVLEEGNIIVLPRGSNLFISELELQYLTESGELLKQMVSAENENAE